MKLKEWGGFIFSTAATGFAIILLSPKYLFSFIGAVVTNNGDPLITGGGMLVYGLAIALPFFSWHGVMTKKFQVSVIFSVLGIAAGVGALIIYKTYLING